MNRFSEKDWKIFRSKIAGWQEVYMDKLNNGKRLIFRYDRKNPDYEPPPEVRPKNLTIGGRFSYGKI